MKCSCGGNVIAKFPYMAEPLCRNCFCSLIERRVRRELKKVVEKDTVLLVDDGTKEFAVLKFLMPKIVHMPAKLIVGRRKVNCCAKIVVNSCADDVVIGYLAAFFTTVATAIKKGKDNRNHIFPLKNVLEEEAELFARIKKLKYGGKKQRNKYQQQLKLDLDGLEKRFPGSKFSLLKSFEQVEDAA